MQSQSWGAFVALAPLLSTHTCMEGGRCNLCWCFIARAGAALNTHAVASLLAQKDLLPLTKSGFVGFPSAAPLVGWAA